MSTDTEAAPDAEAQPRTEPVIRVFAADVTAGDGRTIDMRIVPFGERATVADGHGGAPKGVPYQEEWMPGVFDKQLRAANRVLLNFEHQKGIAGIVGHGIELRAEPDGYHGSFRVHETADGDKALHLAQEGVLGGASVEAFVRKSVRSSAGVIQRVAAHLDAVALCREPAFSGAVVTAIREDDLSGEIFDETLLPVDIDPDLVDRCRRLGIRIPDRLAEALARAFTEMAWDGSASRWDTADAYCAASAIDLNPDGQPKTKEMCHLPFREPGSGMMNVNAIRAALSRLGAGDPTDATQAQRDAARAMLERMLAQFNRNQSST